MLSIFVETSCNRYERDECVFCHVFEPLNPYDTRDLHLTPDQARIMVDKISQVDVLTQLAKQEINLTGGEASMNPDIVEIFKIFKTASSNVCLHTNLDINSLESKRWQRLVDIVNLSGRIDITLYPTVWENRQKTFLSELILIQKRLLVNVIYENLANLKDQIELLKDFFQGKDERFNHVHEMLAEYYKKLEVILMEEADYDEDRFLRRIEQTQAFAPSDYFIFGINLLPAFEIAENGVRAMNSMPFSQEPYLLSCPAVSGEIEIMTVRQDGNMTPCCDVGNLKCGPKFGNLLTDSPAVLQQRFQEASQQMAVGVVKNRKNLENGQGGRWVEEGIPPYCI